MAGVLVQKRGIGARKAAVIIVLIIAVVLGAFALYVNYTLNSATQATVNANVIVLHYGNPSVSVTLVSQDLLSYANSSSLLPYTLFSYSSRNATSIAMNVTVFKSPPPSGVFVLNTSDECFNCGSTPQIVEAMEDRLVRYGIIGNSDGVSTVSLSSVSALPNDSIVVILSGLMPAALLTPNSFNVTPMRTMLNKGISVIYVGQDFSRALLPGSIVIPTSGIKLPNFLETVGPSGNSTKGFFFNKSTFSFSNGANLGGISYENAYNGSIIAFSNMPEAWISYDDVGIDIATAIQKLFWLPSYSTGHTAVNTTGMNTANGLISVIRSGMNVTNKANLKGAIDGSNIGYARAVVFANSTINANVAYQYLHFTPRGSLNGTLSIAKSIVPNQQIPVVMTLFTNSPVNLQIQPHLDIYTLDMSSILTIPLPFFTASGNFTFVKYLGFYLGPGKYIMKLKSFNNSQYSAAYFNVSPVILSLEGANFSSGTFTFSATSAGQKLSDITYNISLNKLYRDTGVIKNGTLTYTLPSGTPVIYGDLNFSIDMLSQEFNSTVTNAPNVITINKQYVELAIVSIVVILMVVLVRAPNRDEFYIDIPSLPEQKKTEIKLKDKEVLSAFDRLNTHYHWRYMPLSSAELRIAISGNIKYNNMPVNLTYSNVDAIINQLIAGGQLIGADGLYAPQAWTTQSGHSIEYLATFKKLRLYLVTHAYLFTDIDSSSVADIVATLRNERKYIIIYSKPMKFSSIPIYSGSKTCIAFLNSEKLEEFKSELYKSMTRESEMLKVYISSGTISLIDADNPSDALG